MEAGIRCKLLLNNINNNKTKELRIRRKQLPGNQFPEFPLLVVYTTLGTFSSAPSRKQNSFGTTTTAAPQNWHCSCGQSLCNSHVLAVLISKYKNKKKRTLLSSFSTLSHGHRTVGFVLFYLQLLLLLLLLSSLYNMKERADRHTHTSFCGFYDVSTLPSEGSSSCT